MSKVYSWLGVADSSKNSRTQHNAKMKDPNRRYQLVEITALLLLLHYAQFYQLSVRVTIRETLVQKTNYLVLNWKSLE